MQDLVLLMSKHGEAEDISNLETDSNAMETEDNLSVNQKENENVNLETTLEGNWLPSPPPPANTGKGEKVQIKKPTNV